MYRAQEKGHAVEGVPYQDQFADLILLPQLDSDNGTRVQFDIDSGAKARQRVLILEALRQGPLSTLEARERLGVLHAPGRVLELRKAGFAIETRTSTKFDSEGRPHRVGLYVLSEGGAT